MTPLTDEENINARFCDALNIKLGHRTPTPGDAQPWHHNAAALAVRVQIVHRHEYEGFLECWVDGKHLAYCANHGTTLVLGASKIGLSADDMNAITKGLS